MTLMKQKTEQKYIGILYSATKLLDMLVFTNREYPVLYITVLYIQGE
jgi:hypothetical protein